jgi:hypothetical protein
MCQDERPPIIMAWGFLLAASVLSIAAIAISAEIVIYATRVACRAAGYVAR